MAVFAPKLSLGISQDSGVVICEFNVVCVHPVGAPRVRSRSRQDLLHELSLECHAHNMAPRVAINIGVDADG